MQIRQVGHGGLEGCAVDSRQPLGIIKKSLL
jgi:hypothetical protein